VGPGSGCARDGLTALRYGAHIGSWVERWAIDMRLERVIKTMALTSVIVAVERLLRDGGSADGQVGASFLREMDSGTDSGCARDELTVRAHLHPRTLVPPHLSLLSSFIPPIPASTS